MATHLAAAAPGTDTLQYRRLLQHRKSTASASAGSTINTKDTKAGLYTQ